MKIISGMLKGRKIKGYDIEGTRPTMDRVKESLFGMIQNKVRDSVVLDLFAGTGNLGFEAISNGAKICYFNDSNKKCIALIEENARVFEVKDHVQTFSLDYRKALSCFSSSQLSFDLIFLDPPYRMNCLNEVIDFIFEHQLLAFSGLLICEVDNLYLQDVPYSKIKEKKYGDKYLVIYENNL